MKTLHEQLRDRRERDAEAWAALGVSPKYATESVEGARIFQAVKAGATPRDELIEKLAEALTVINDTKGYAGITHVVRCVAAASTALAELERFVSGGGLE